MDQLEPLNPGLLHRLQSRYGDVRVHAPGIELEWQSYRDPLVKGNPVRRRVVVRGEEYFLNCPFCGDTRRRLFISYRWGVWDEANRSRNLWLMHCFNEECQSDPSVPQQLYNALQLSNRVRFKLRPGRKLQATDSIEVQPPGIVTRLDELFMRHPKHHALAYVQDRNFDPVYLGRKYQVGYCADSNFRLASDRLIIPISEKQRLVGWQARYLGESVHGESFKEAGVPKYWGCPHMQKQLLAYNFERAVQHPTIVIVEGATDVWKTGPQAMGLLGKTMNPLLVAKLVKAVSGRDVRIAVMLDPEQDPKEEAKGRPHHITVVHMALRKHFGKCVFPVFLPTGLDPGSADREFARDCMREAAAKAGLRISFAKPERRRDAK